MAPGEPELGPTACGSVYSLARHFSSADLDLCAAVYCIAIASVIDRGRVQSWWFGRQRKVIGHFTEPIGSVRHLRWPGRTDAHKRNTPHEEHKAQTKGCVNSRNCGTCSVRSHVDLDRCRIVPAQTAEPGHQRVGDRCHTNKSRQNLMWHRTAPSRCYRGR